MDKEEPIEDLEEELDDADTNFVYDHLIWISQDLEGKIDKGYIETPEGQEVRMVADLHVADSPLIFYIAFEKRMKPVSDDEIEKRFCRTHNRQLADGTIKGILDSLIEEYEVSPCEPREDLFGEDHVVFAYKYSPSDQSQKNKTY